MSIYDDPKIHEMKYLARQEDKIMDLVEAKRDQNRRAGYVRMMVYEDEAHVILRILDKYLNSDRKLTREQQARASKIIARLEKFPRRCTDKDRDRMLVHKEEALTILPVIQKFLSTASHLSRRETILAVRFMDRLNRVPDRVNSGVSR